MAAVCIVSGENMKYTTMDEETGGILAIAGRRVARNPRPKSDTSHPNLPAAKKVNFDRRKAQKRVGLVANGLGSRGQL